MGTYSKLLSIEKEAKAEASAPSSEPVKKSTPPKKKPKVIKTTNKAIKKDINKEKNKEIKISTFLDFAASALDEKPTQPQHYNYPPFVVEMLENLLYDLKVKERKQTKRPKWRATKTTVFILSVLYLVWDYRENQAKSILHKAIFEDR